MAGTDRFCKSCGTAIASPSTPASPPAVAPASVPAPPPPVASAPPPPAYAPPPPLIASPPGPFVGAPASGAASGAAMTMGQYLGTFILLSIPVLNIILILMWAFGGNVNPNKKNLARALLVMILIFAVLALVVNIGVMGAFRRGY